MEEARFVYKDGQICRVTESFEPVDLAQLESVVNQHEAVVANLETELEELDKKRELKLAEIGGAERVRDQSKRHADAARALVAEPGDANETDGAGSESDYQDSQPGLQV